MPIDVVEIFQFAGIGFVLGLLSWAMKKFSFNENINELVMLAGYVYMLIFITQLVSVLLNNLKDIFML
ncbi:MAG TPA: stage III sporulation protein AC [Firmicutes bacterium]|nr:stage III sporulation protein AC [Bacillota bacterium]